MAKKTATMDELFAKAGQVATKATPKSTKKEAPIVYIDEEDKELIAAVDKMVRLLVLNGKVTVALKNRKEDGEDRLFRQWVAQVWETRAIPENSRMAIRKKGGIVIDMSVIFQVKHKADGIKLPDQLKPGQTAADHILMELTSPVVGLSRENATKLVKDGALGEIIITNEYYIPDFVTLNASKDDEVRSGAEKVFRFLWGEKVVAPTPEERVKILLQRRVIRLKDGFISRSFTYCEDAEQLYNLLQYVKVGLALSNPKFAEGDTLVEQNSRLHQTVDELVIGSENSEFEDE